VDVMSPLTGFGFRFEFCGQRGHLGGLQCWSAAKSPEMKKASATLVKRLWRPSISHLPLKDLTMGPCTGPKIELLWGGRKPTALGLQLVKYRTHRQPRCVFY